MKLTFRAKITTSAIFGFAFSAMLFRDVALGSVLGVILLVMLSEAVYLKHVANRSDRFFSCSGDPKSSGPYSFEKSTYPGDRVRGEFYFVKRTRCSVRFLRAIEFLEFVPALVAKEASSTIRMQFNSPYSGEYSSEKLRLEATGPLGLFADECSIPAKFEFKVYPRVLDIAITSSRLLGKGGIGETPIDMPGVGTEFYDMRSYQYGDDIRQVNWKASARLRRLMVNDRAREVGASYYVVLDATSPDFFDRDRLASAFLQMANSLAILGARFGVLVYDGKKITVSKRIDQPMISLGFALDAAITLGNLGESSFPEELVPIPSARAKLNRDSLSNLGLGLLSQMEESARVNMRASVGKSELFTSLMSLVRQDFELVPAILYVGPFGALSPLVELEAQLRSNYGSKLIVVNPTAPWVVAPSEDDGVELYNRHAKSLESLRAAGIECYTGEPGIIVQQIPL